MQLNTSEISTYCQRWLRDPRPTDVYTFVFQMIVILLSAVEALVIAISQNFRISQKQLLFRMLADYRSLALVLMLCAFFALPASTYSSAITETKPTETLERIDPPNWWVGMKSRTVELLMYGNNIATCALSMAPYKGVAIERIDKVENPNYLFVRLSIAPTTKPGALMFTLAESGGKKTIQAYELRARTRNNKRYQGFSATDVIYMLMPDRFANGDPSNDNINGFSDKMHRDSLHYRHGGDIQGMINHLDYIQDLGMTAIWSTPLLENNMRAYSYHGYAITDFYAIDRRFGTNDDYRRYVDSCHARGLKVIMDVVLNHMGDQNYLALDPPSQHWINDSTLTKSSDRRNTIIKPHYRASTHSDPYASDFDKRGMTERWFDWMMPDLNARDAHCATYLIQNTLWWVEFSGLDGLRIDTYPYPDKQFTVQWAKAVRQEYPSLGLVGEVWIGESTGMSAYWQANARNNDGFNSHLPTITDFPLNTALCMALNEQEGWSSGLIRLYNTLAEDFLYPDPLNNVIFLDNHDLSRYFSVVKERANAFKMALTFLLTTRGTPQIYYATELAAAGWKNPDPLVRRDFPGGWKEDTVNAFLPSGRNALQNDVFNHLRTLAQWRSKTRVVQTGKLMQFIPFDGIYTYFRYNGEQSVMVVLNNADTAKSIETTRFSERLNGYTKAVNILTGAALPSLSTITIPAKSSLVLELQK